MPRQASKSVNILEAKTQLSRLVERIESGAGAEAALVIARNGRPAARLVPLAKRSAPQRIGVAAGAFAVPDFLVTPLQRCHPCPGRSAARG